MDLLHFTKNSQPSAIFQKRDRTLTRPLYTIAALDPLCTIAIKDRQAQIDFKDGKIKRMQIDGCPFEFLHSFNTTHSPAISGIAPDINFAAGMIGYLGFGLVSSIENITKQKTDPFAIPDSIVFIPQTIIYVDHCSQYIHVISHAGPGRRAEVSELVLRLNAGNPGENGEFKQGAESFGQSGIAASVSNSLLSPSMSRSSFIEKTVEAKKFIEEGQCFQIVLSQRFSGPVNIGGGELFSTILETAPSTYNYLLSFPEFQYLGASPETMIGANKDQVRLCALAGTRPRGTTLDRDAENEIELRNNEKERAEHMMLVDLGRNDLGKVCAPGSITVGPIARVLKYSNVMHLATEIFGSLESNENQFTALRACFPRGTVSGAPKIRALELLSKLEPEQRGIYSGAVGFFDKRGHMDTAIAIRSALLKNGIAHVNAGAGIVYDSEPEFEYTETIHKASAMTSLMQTAGSADNPPAPSCRTRSNSNGSRINPFTNQQNQPRTR